MSAAVGGGILFSVKLRKGHRNPAARLRSAVEALPRHSREAMLRGIDDNPIIAGAYADSPTGGICPMLAAHRNGGRTDLSSFARCWDFYTGARRARLVSPRELRTLRSYLEISLIGTAQPTEAGGETMVEAAGRIRAERSRARTAGVVADAVEASRERVPTGERDRSGELRDRPSWSWIRPSRDYETYRSRLAAASEQLSEQRAAELLGPAEPGTGGDGAQVEKAEGSPGRV